MSDLDEKILDAEITFRVRPTPISCQLRPIYRIALLTLLFDQCREQRATMLQIQVLNWAIRSPANRRNFLEFMGGLVAPGSVVVRFDPSIGRAIDFALAEQVLVLPLSDDDKKDVPQRIPMRLAARGIDLATRVNQMPDVMVVEKNFLRSIGSKVTQKMVESLFPKDVQR